MMKIKEISLNEKPCRIHLLSGGLDSAYSLLELAKGLKDNNTAVIHPIFFDYGHYAANVEWKKVKEIVKHVRDFLQNESIIDDPIKISLKSDLFHWCKNDAFVGNEGVPNSEIENRNMVLFSVLASYLIACAEHQDIKSPEFEITSGFKEKELDDANAEFFEAMKKLLKVYKKDFTFNFRILQKMGHPQILKKTKKLLNGDEVKLQKFWRLTISCYSPTKEGDACNKCSKCTSVSNEKKLMTFH